MAPAFLLAAIAVTGALMGGVIAWARHRQQRRAQAARQAKAIAGANAASSRGARRG